MSEEFTNYVVEVGVDQTTGFFYRKWNDGLAKLWALLLSPAPMQQILDILLE